MAAAESKKTSSSTPVAAGPRPPLTPQQVNAGRKILSAMQAHHKRVQQQLEAVGPKVYNDLRVYHGTHDTNAARALNRGLKPQGGKGLSGMIGDKARSKGKVFFTQDKEQAAYYAQTAAGMHRLDLRRMARAARDADAEAALVDNPPRATVLRLMLAPSVQREAVRDEKGDTKDFTLQREVSAGLVLPGHLEGAADMSKRAEAVSLFQAELHNRRVFATPAQAGAALERLRRNSIAGDPAALESKYAKESSAKQLGLFSFMFT